VSSEEVPVCETAAHDNNTINDTDNEIQSPAINHSLLTGIGQPELFQWIKNFSDEKCLLLKVIHMITKMKT